ncbi:hypothetical protein [Halosolutus gelatinilyticus]|nr:hypothetical protein [Halosolutus gelatinilyticus]
MASGHDLLETDSAELDARMMRVSARVEQYGFSDRRSPSEWHSGVNA